MADLVGSQLKGYHIVERIRGPMMSLEVPDDGNSDNGLEVYRAVGPQGEGPVAIRVFSFGKHADRRRLQRLQESMQAVANLRHPGIPPILGSGMIQGRPYIVTPFLGAGSLADRYASGLARTLCSGQVLDEISAALDHSHKHGVVHGELKPSSVLFDEESGSIRLVGLGEAMASSLGSMDLGNASPVVDAYQAPEVAAGEPVTPHSDQYSFGVLALEMLTHMPAIQALTWLRGSAEADWARPNDDRSGRTDLQPQVRRALSRMIAGDPRQRFATIGEANRALKAALGYNAPAAEPEPAPQPASPPKRRRRRMGLTWAASVLALIGLLAVIPAFSAGLIRLPGDAQGQATTASSRQSISGQGILLPWEDPGDAGPADPVPAGSLEVQDRATLQPGLSESPTDDSASEAQNPTQSQEALQSASPTPTSVATSTDMPTPTSTGLPPTSTPLPPTDEPGSSPTLNPKKCRDDPSHKNFCTPVP